MGKLNLEQRNLVLVANETIERVAPFIDQNIYFIVMDSMGVTLSVIGENNNNVINESNKYCISKKGTFFHMVSNEAINKSDSCIKNQKNETRRDGTDGQILIQGMKFLLQSIHLNDQIFGYIGMFVDAKAEMSFASPLLKSLVFCIENSYAQINKYGVKEYIYNISTLTKREKEITLYLLQNKTRNDIAQITFLSKETVKTHIKNIYSKLEVKDKYSLLTKLLDSCKNFAVKQSGHL